MRRIAKLHRSRALSFAVSARQPQPEAWLLFKCLLLKARSGFNDFFIFFFSTLKVYNKKKKLCCALLSRLVSPAFWVKLKMSKRRARAGDAFCCCFPLLSLTLVLVCSFRFVFEREGERRKETVDATCLWMCKKRFSSAHSDHLFGRNRQ